MTMSLRWRPVPRNNGKPLSEALKFALRNEWGAVFSRTLVDSDIAFLRGLRAGSSDAAAKEEILALIEAIEKHGAIEIWIGE